MQVPVVALGADGCRRGWAVVSVDSQRQLDLFVAEHLGDVASRHPGAVLAVDIPIGLTDQPRGADLAARGVLGPASPSVFNAPPRTVVDEFRAGTVTTHAQVSARSRAVSGKGLSVQSWNLIPKVAEVDVLAEHVGDRLLEVHPEVSFRALADGGSLAPKWSSRGVHQRLSLLEQVGFAHVTGLPAGEHVAIDDALDAAVAAWTAHGAALGERLRSYPERPRQHDRGRSVAIWARDDTNWDDRTGTTGTDEQT